MSLKYTQIDKKEVKRFCPNCEKKKRTFVGTLGIRHCSDCFAPVDFMKK
jgi:hypothetical protein